ncbi:VOC family protein [Streptomyces marincola]|uniref:VOC domain-containing protein n=1 Tax=Streptomyces marincola TaxID=2878388 RepID=A0A1W7D5D2_9ACTN|nr:VOC family protein [Streptomyces marincola]ARQ72301.1 hypothetical protein CAG99_11850 [Streptomyces marincola]
MSDLDEGFPTGAPCWADATVPDMTVGTHFYERLFGWSFAAGSSEYGGYATASLDGRAVAGLAPCQAGQDAPPAWTLYLASPDVAGTAELVREHGGRVLLEPMQVGEVGRMLIATDPGGVLFGVWEAGAHRGFGRRDEPGAFCWAEVVTRDPAAADAFFPAVFPFEARRVEDPDGLDYQVYTLDGRPVLGRMAVPADGPAPHVLVYVAVPDCDGAVETVRQLGGRVADGPVDSPFGRFATVVDPQGVRFAVIDLSAVSGEPPATHPA